MSEIRRTGSEDQCRASVAMRDDIPVQPSGMGAKQPLCAEGCGSDVTGRGMRCQPCRDRLIQQALAELELRRSAREVSA